MPGILDNAKSKAVSALLEAAMTQAGDIELRIGMDDIGSFLMTHTVSIGKEPGTGNLLISIKKRVP